MPLHLFPCQSWWGEAQRHSVDALGELLDNVNIKVDDPCHLDFFQAGPVIIMSTMQPSDGFCYSGPTYRHIDDPPFSNYIP